MDEDKQTVESKDADHTPYIARTKHPVGVAYYTLNMEPQLIPELNLNKHNCEWTSEVGTEREIQGQRYMSEGSLVVNRCVVYMYF